MAARSLKPTCLMSARALLCIGWMVARKHCAALELASVRSADIPSAPSLIAAGRPELNLITIVVGTKKIPIDVSIRSCCTRDLSLSPRFSTSVPSKAAFRCQRGKLPNNIASPLGNRKKAAHQGSHIRRDHLEVQKGVNYSHLERWFPYPASCSTYLSNTQGKYAEADIFCLKAVNIAEDVHGPYHSSLAGSLCIRANVLKNQVRESCPGISCTLRTSEPHRHHISFMTC